MNDGTTKTIEMIEVGDKLENNNLVTAKLQLNGKGIQMYKINGVIVSETHTLKYEGKWISVKMHPHKICIDNYNEPYIYCLNTTSKEININNIIFADWDELYDEQLLKILDLCISNETKYEKISLKENIHKFLDTGFEKDTLILKDNVLIPIQQIKVGDVIGNDNDIVYGVVHILNNQLTKKINKNNKFSKNNKKTKLFHILTYTNKFTIDGKVFDDYNSLIDIKLHK
jgi:hypothetical protein